MSKLEELLMYVSEHNEFYKKIIHEYGITNPTDITQYPVLTRQQLQDNRYNMFSDGYKSKYFYQQLRRQSSSGSVGIPVSVYWDDRDYYSSVRPLWNRRLQYYGIHPYDRQVVFGLDSPEIPDAGRDVFYINDPKHVLNINVNSIHKNNDYEKMIDIINKFEPVWLYVRPFILQRLISSYKIFKKEPPPTIRYIESIAEILSPELKESAMKLFKAPVVNMYGSEEMNGIAYECAHKYMHIINENVYVECMSKDGKIQRSGNGEAIITSLTNRAMPLIRYNQGDEIVLSHQSLKVCECGSMSHVIELIGGRTLDNIIINDELSLNSIVFLEIMGEVNNIYNSILTCYKFIYNKSEKKLRCYIELEKNRTQWYIQVKKTIEGVFNKRVPSILGISLEVLLTESIDSFDRKHRILEVV